MGPRRAQLAWVAGLLKCDMPPAGAVAVQCWRQCMCAANRVLAVCGPKVEMVLVQGIGGAVKGEFAVCFTGL